MKSQFERDLQKYERICHRNKDNIEKRWANNLTGKSGIPNDTKNTTGKSGIPNDTKNTDTDDDTDSDTETVSDTVTDDDYDDSDLYGFYRSSSSNFQEENSDKLKNAIALAVKTFGTEKIKNAISRAATSWYCNGYNETGVKASMTWILKSIEKILSGDYDSHGLPIYSQAGVKFSDHQRIVLHANEPGLIGKMRMNSIDWNIPVPSSGPSGRGYKTRSDIVKDKVNEAKEDLARRIYENQHSNDNT